MKLKTTQTCHLECGIVKAPGRDIDIPSKEAEKLIAAGKAISLENTEEPKTKVKPLKK